MSTRPPWEDFPDDVEPKPWEDFPDETPTATPASRPKPRSPLSLGPRNEPVTAKGFLSEVPGVIKDYGLGALKGAGRLATGLVSMDPFKPTSALGSVDPMRAQRKAEIDKMLGLEAEGGVQEAGGALPYLAAGPQGILASAGTAAAGSYLETQDPTEAVKSGALGLLTGVPASTKKLAGPLMRGAVSQYEKALHPTTRAAKVDAARIIPELLERRVSGNLDELAKMGTEKSEQAGQQIAKRYALSTKQVDAAQLADDLEKLKSPFMGQAGAGGSVGGNPVAAGSPVVLDDAAVGKIEEIQAKLREFGTAVPPKELWKYRQVLDRVVRASNGFTKELSPETAAEISREARRVVQAELNKKIPNIQKMNAEYALWESLQDVAGETALRKTGQQGLPGMLARGAGAVVGGGVGQMVGGPFGMVAGAAAGQQATKKIADLMATPAWRTVSAVNKARVSDFLSRGETEMALDYLSRVLTGGAASAEPRATR